MGVVGAVVSTVASVGSTIAGMSASKKQAKAQKQAAQESAENTRAYNEENLKLLEEQQARSSQFADAQYRDTRNYTFDKGLKLLSQQKDMGWDRLMTAYNQYQEAQTLRATQDAETANLAAKGFITQEQALQERNRLEEEIGGRELSAKLMFAAEDTRNQLGAVAERHAATAKELVLRDEAAQEQHTLKQVVGAMEQRAGIGKLVAATAASGVIGGAATAARQIGRQFAIQQKLDDVQLKLDRGLYQLAGQVADQERMRSEFSLTNDFNRQRALGLLDFEGMQRGNRLTEEQTRQQNDLNYERTLVEQRQGREQMAFKANKDIESSFLDLRLDLQAGVTDLQVRLADLDFEHANATAEKAMTDAFRMENAQLNAKYDILDSESRAAYASTMGRINSTASMWQGVAGISSSLWSGYQNYQKISAPTPRT